MKTVLFIFLAIVLSFKQTNAQFNSMTNCNGNNGIGHSVFFLNADTGFVAGEHLAKASFKGPLMVVTPGAMCILLQQI